MSRPPRPLLLRRANLLWHPLTLLPIVTLLLAAVSGPLPPLLALFLWMFARSFTDLGGRSR